MEKKYKKIDWIKLITEHLKNIKPDFYGEIMIKFQEGMPVLLTISESIRVRDEIEKDNLLNEKKKEKESLINICDEDENNHI